LIANLLKSSTTPEPVTVQKVAAAAKPFLEAMPKEEVFEDVHMPEVHLVEPVPEVVVV